MRSTWRISGKPRQAARTASEVRTPDLLRHPPSPTQISIYEAATDDTDRFRYLVGDYAKQWAAMPTGMDGEDHFASMSAQFGL